MSTTENKTITRRYFEEIWNQKNMAAIEALLAPHAVGHVSNQTFGGREVLPQRVNATYSVYTRPHFTVEDQIAEGDKVLVRWTFQGQHTGEYMGAAATGRQVTVTGLSLFRLAQSKIEELWLNSDDLGELQQLGLAPLLSEVSA
jgi:steroid delta-isomerase-like uncharacterized protein